LSIDDRNAWICSTCDAEKPQTPNSQKVIVPVQDLLNKSFRDLSELDSTTISTQLANLTQQIALLQPLQ
jgi:hypothetical protein